MAHKLKFVLNLGWSRGWVLMFRESTFPENLLDFWLIWLFNTNHLTFHICSIPLQSGGEQN